MKISNCPTCGGSKKIKSFESENMHGRVVCALFKADGTTQPGITKPCPTCQDSDGNPTGRIAVLSFEELEKLNAQGADLSEGPGMTEPIAREHSYRLTHRSKEKGEGE